MLDFFEEDIYPSRKAQEDVAIGLAERTCGADYLETLRDHVPETLDHYQPDFVLYNAGSDVLQTDPLARLTLTPQDLAERDLYVVSEVRNRGIKLAMVRSGQYGRLSWEAHARSIEGIWQEFDK